jgi:CBS domain containing-hemolysin-like protein
MPIAEFFTPDTSQALQPHMVLRYILQIMLLIGSSFFSGSETALFSLSHVDLQQLRRSGHQRAGILQDLLDEPRRLVVSILCGNELVNIAATTNMTGILVILYGETRAGIITILVMLPLLLLFGEVTPKTVAVSNPGRVSSAIVAVPMYYWVKIITPLRWLIRLVSDRITTWIVGPQRSAEHILQIDEFRSLIEDVAEEGKLNSTARMLINNLLSAGNTEIVKIMTPRSRTSFLDADQDMDELMNTFKKLRHSRVPVYRQHRDNLIGFLYAEDVLEIHLQGRDPSEIAVEELVRPPAVVPLTKKVDEMFDYFQKSHTRAVAVLNEFGGVAGFITIRDVLRYIFGELATKKEEEARVQEVAPHVYELPGDVKLTELNRLTGIALKDPRMTTVAGVAFRHLDRLPREGDRITVDNITITVQEMDAHRIARVRLAVNGRQEEDTSPADETGIILAVPENRTAGETDPESAEKS